MRQINGLTDEHAMIGKDIDNNVIKKIMRIKRPPVLTLGNRIQMVKQKGHRADALALRADERRDKLR